MGILSFLFSLLKSKSKISDSEKRIENFKKNIEIIKKNSANKKQAHYKESARKNIETLKYQIKKETEKIKKAKM